MNDDLVIGRVRSAFGTSGELKVESLSGEFDHFLRLKQVKLRQGNEVHQFSVESVRRSNTVLLMKLEGLETREAASRMRTAEILVCRRDAAPLGDDEYYYADLVGLRVRFDSEVVGTVSAIRDGGAHPLIEVKHAGGECLIPFAAPFFGEVRVAEGDIELIDRGMLE